MALPQEFDYASAIKPSAAAARGYSARLFPEAGTEFQGGSVINIDIPAGRPGEYLRATESSLMFTITNSGASAANANDAMLDGGAWAVIKKLEIFHGAALLESIDNYNILHSMLYDVTTSQAYRTGVGNLIHGTNTSANVGSITSTVIKGVTIAESGGKVHVALQLASCLVGTLAERMIPLGLLSADIRLRIELASDASAYYHASAGAAPVIKYTDFEYNAVLVALDPSVDQAVASENSGVLSMHTSSFRSYTHTVTNGAVFDVLQLPVRYSSLRYMLHALQPSSNAADKQSYSIGARETANVIQLQYRMGSLLVPQRPLKMSSGLTGNGAELTEQLLRIFGKLQSMGDDFGVVMTDKSIFLKNDVSANATLGTAILGCDLNAFGGNLDDLANSGQNLLSTPVSLEITFDATNKAPHDLRVTTFASFDQLLMLDMQTGLLSVRF